MGNAWAFGLLLTIATAGCGGSFTPASVVHEAPFRSFTWGSAVGPCPPGAVCSGETRVDGEGHVTSVEGTQTRTATLSPLELADLANTVASAPAIASLRDFHPCAGPSDFSESVELNVAGAPPIKAVLYRMVGTNEPACDEALAKAIEAQIMRIRDRHLAPKPVQR